MRVMHSLYQEAGAVRIEESKSKRCGRCVSVCPTQVLCMENGHVSVNENGLLGCIACGHCMMTCPEGSITVTVRGISPKDLRPLTPASNRPLRLSSQTHNPAKHHTAGMGWIRIGQK